MSANASYSSNSSSEFQKKATAAVATGVFAHTVGHIAMLAVVCNPLCAPITLAGMWLGWKAASGE